jgi:tetratricopeptide (TPR) repeat protein
LRESLSESEADKQLQNIDKDLASAQKSAAEHPEDPALQAAWGTALSKAGDYAAAMHAAERALVLDSTQPEAHFLLGSMLGGEPPNSEQAIPHLKMYLQHVLRTPETSKNITDAYSMLGDIYGRSGREQQALEAYEEGIKTGTNEDSLSNNASWIYSTAQDASLRNPQKALAYARKAVALSNGKKAHVLDTLGEALYANGLFDEAVATEKKAIALQPGEGLYADQLKKFQAAKDHGGKTKP